MSKEIKPFINIGPGEFIKEELEVRNWTQEDLANILGFSQKHVNEIITNKKTITIDTAKLLNKVFSQSPQYWINLDTNYRLRLKTANQKEEAAELKAWIYYHMPIKEMIQKEWINRYNNLDELKNELRKFWEIHTNEISCSVLSSVWEEFEMNFRKSEAYEQFNKYYGLTWFNMAKKCAKMYEVNKYSETKFRDIIKEINLMTTEKDGIQIFLNELNKAGVKFFVLSHLQKTYIDGASFFDKKNPAIVYTKRYNRIDNFWFTIAHEIAHILLHLKKEKDFFIDNLEEINTQEESEADKFACNILKVNEILEYFKNFTKYISEVRVRNCAAELRVNPAIIVGVLQHYNKLSRKSLNRFKVPVSDSIDKYYFAEEQFND